MPGAADLPCPISPRPLNPNLRHQFYRRSWHFSEEWRLYVRDLMQRGDGLGAELVIVRLKLREVIAYLNRGELPPGGFLAAVRVVWRAMGTIRRLVKARHKLEEERILPSPSPPPPLPHPS